MVASYDSAGGAVCAPRPPGPPGEGEALRAAKFDKDNEWRAAVDKLRPPRAANATSAAVANGTASYPNPTGGTAVDVALGEAGVAAAVRQHMGELRGAGEPGAAPRGSGGAPSAEELDPTLDLPAVRRLGDPANASGLAGAKQAAMSSAAVARRSRAHRAMRSPRSLKWA